MLLVMLNMALKLSLIKGWWLAVIALVCTLWIGFSWHTAIDQSRNQIAEWLADQPLMLDVSVILVLEVLWQMAYCLLAGKLLYGEPVGRRVIWCYRVLRFFPGILFFPVLYYLLVQVIYLFPGAGFATVSWSLGLLVGILLPAVALGIRWLLPEKEIRLELLFLGSALVLTLGIIATVNGTTTFKGSDPIEWMALAAFFVVALVCALVGFFRYKRTIVK